MATRATTQRSVRTKKLSTKAHLQIYRENELEATIEDVGQGVAKEKVETGVEKAEESELHLQAVIAASQAPVTSKSAKDVYIPTPESKLSNLQYETLYPPIFQQPQTYIRFSSTVEDSIGCPYCMSLDDEIWLKKYNAKKSKSHQCSEDQFEEVMNFFEQASSLKQPFAAVDNAPVLSYADMEAAFDETIEDTSRRFAKDIYEHWKLQRETRLNEPLMPTLKFERNQGSEEDSDPYICFRRREIRQTRKTRGRDAQITEKLKKLRLELEQARQLMATVKQREILRRDQLQLEKSMFLKRCDVKETKRNLGIKDDDEDLINQKPVPKPKPRLDTAITPRGPPGMIPKIPLERGDGRPPEALLPQLIDEKSRKEAEINHMIQESMMKHRAWNNDWVDNTWRPITPPLESANQSFRTAVAEFLPTPPASVSDEVEGFGLDAMTLDKRADPQDKLGNGNVPIRYASPPMEEIKAPRPSYRKRYGRGGRLFVDRRGLKRPLLSPTDDEDDGAMDERMKERSEYDVESDDEPQVYISDPHDYWNTKFRIHFSGAGAVVRDPTLQQKMIEEAQRRQAAAASTNAAVNREAAQGARAQLPPTAQMQR